MAQVQAGKDDAGKGKNENELKPIVMRHFTTYSE